MTENLENVYSFRLFLCNGTTRVGPSLYSVHHKTEADSEFETFWVLAREDSNKTAVTPVAVLAKYACRRIKAILSIDVGVDVMRMVILFYKE